MYTQLHYLFAYQYLLQMPVQDAENYEFSDPCPPAMRYVRKFF